MLLIKQGRLRRAVLMMVLALCFGFSLSAKDKPDKAERFRWTNLKTNEEIVSAVQKALKDYDYTHLREIGIVRDSALVITSTRLSDMSSSEASFDLYTAHNLDLKTQKLTLLWRGYKLNILGDEQFEASSISDIIFTYDRCVECEPSTHLTAFHYDNGWRVRAWGGKELPGALVNNSGMEEGWSITFVYAIDNFEGKNRKQLAVWWRETNKKTRAMNESVTVYSVEKSTESAQRVKDKLAINNVKRKLCNSHAVIAKGQDTAVCKPFLSHQKQ